MDIENQKDQINFEIAYDNTLLNQFTWPLGKSGGIAYVDSIFSENFCNSIIKYCSENTKNSKPGRTIGGISPTVKVSQDWHLGLIDGSSELEKEFDFRISEELKRCIYIYQNSFLHLQLPQNASNFIIGDTAYQVQLYKKNSGFYSEHIDGAPWVEKRRVLAGIIYLNTVESGGGTQFPLHNITIDAVAGRVALFPAHWLYPHGGLMPLSSDKWIVSTFFFGRECE